MLIQGLSVGQSQLEICVKADRSPDVIRACVTSLSTCYLLTLTSLPASVTLIYSTFSLAWTGAVNIVITLLPALVQYHQPPATSHEAVVYECSSDPFNKNIFII